MTGPSKFSISVDGDFDDDDNLIGTIKDDLKVHVTLDDNFTPGSGDSHHSDFSHDESAKWVSEKIKYWLGETDAHLKAKPEPFSQARMQKDMVSLAVVHMATYLSRESHSLCPWILSSVEFNGVTTYQEEAGATETPGSEGPSDQRESLSEGPQGDSSIPNDGKSASQGPDSQYFGFPGGA